jgi:hypothetical protein
MTPNPARRRRRLQLWLQRRWGWVSGCFVVLVVACGGSQAGVVAPASSDEPPPRRPDGVVVEPPPAMPSAVARAPARGVIALREPLGSDAVRELVTELMDAWVHESLDALVGLLAADAGPMEARSRGRAKLAEDWRARIQAHEYNRLEGVELVRPERIERYDWQDLAASDAPPRPPDMHQDELYVRVPLDVTRAAGEKVFGDVIELLVRIEQGKYKITAYRESDLP